MFTAHVYTDEQKVDGIRISFPDNDITAMIEDCDSDIFIAPQFQVVNVTNENLPFIPRIEFNVWTYQNEKPQRIMPYHSNAQYGYHMYWIWGDFETGNFVSTVNRPHYVCGYKHTNQYTTIDLIYSLANKILHIEQEMREKVNKLKLHEVAYKYGMR